EEEETFGELEKQGTTNPASPLCTGQEQFGLSADEDDGHRLYEFSIRSISK
ncbi:15332_t:CDS:2, partial [Funneliformis mosseae]